MGFMDRVFGQGPSSTTPAGRDGAVRGSADDRALERYRYLLRTAPPEAIEQAHAEAFAQLTPEQRSRVLRELGHDASSADSSPQALARVATRAEIRQPGTLERAFGGISMGGLLAGSLLSSIAGSFIGTAIAQQFLDGFNDDSAWGDTDAEGLESAQADAESSALEDDPGFEDTGSDFGGDFLDV